MDRYMTDNRTSSDCETFSSPEEVQGHGWEHEIRHVCKHYVTAHVHQEHNPMLHTMVTMHRHEQCAQTCASLYCARSHATVRSQVWNCAGVQHTF